MRTQNRSARGDGLFRRCAFTLIELLVVVAIMALLISILLPALSAARRSGRVVVCLSNMRQLGQMSLLYAHENNDRLPGSLHSGFAFGSGTNNGEPPVGGAPWGYGLYKYITNQAWTPSLSIDAFAAVAERYYRCPFDKRPTRKGFAITYSYGINVYFELTSEETGGPTWHMTTDIPRTESTVLFGELYVKDESMYGMVDHHMAHTWAQRYAEPDVDQNRHKPDACYAFVDGHAESAAFITTFDFNHQEDWPRIDCWNPATAR